MSERPSPIDPWLGAQYPTLARLLGAYFHEDWQLEAKTPFDAVRQFRRDDGQAAVQKASGDIERLLQDMNSEAELLVALDTLGSCYSPALDRMSAREWLVRAATILVAAG